MKGMMMLSQLNLRFHRKLIAALKTRAGTENISVNALAERFLDNGLKTAATGDDWFALLADPEMTVQQLYRQIVLGQTFGTAPVTRDELRFMLTYAREAFVRGHGRLASLPALRTLLEITRDLLAWQVGNDRVLDSHCLKGIFRLRGENWTEEFEAFLTQLRPVIDQGYAEHLLRPLESDGFALADVPDAVLAEIFTLPRLKSIFPLLLRGLDWTDEKAATLAQALHPLIPAVTEIIEAGTLRLEIRVEGQHPDQRPGPWYDVPKMHLLITGREFVVPVDWATFTELLGLFSLYTRFPEALAHGHHGDRVMFSPPGHVMADGFFGLDGLRIFLPAEDFATLVRELVARCSSEGTLAEALSGLRGLYGDL